VEAAVATHNVRSLALAAALAESREMKPGEFEVQMLYGMADPLKDAIAGMGHRVRVYVPFGELLPGMSYLVRRLLENTASQSFLRMGFAEDVPADQLLAPPARTVAAPTARVVTPGASFRGHDGSRPPAFRNEPVYRFTGQGERERLAAAIDTVRGQFGETYPLYIKGHEVTPEEVISSENPARPSEVVGWVGSGTQHHAEAAIRAAAGAFPAWRSLSATARAEFLLAAADRIRARRAEFAAWEVFEAGKNWREADADVTEAIDFLEYYSHEAIRLSAPMHFNVAGETNEYFYQPRGVGVVISPWNFPLAILTGMLAATIVTGNTAVVKPSERTPVIAAKLIEVLREVGVPPGVVNFVPGPGQLVGEYLVRHPQTHLIAFTGSRAVGSRIAMLAAEIPRGQQHLKHVIAELGGKNAIIVDHDADVDDAVFGTVASAFGFQGQKCSAASRAIVVGDLYDTFVRRLVEAARSLKIGSPEDPGNFMGPVIDKRAQEGILRAIEEGKRVANAALESDTAHLGEGYWVGPTIFTDVPADSPLAQEEIFGPVLAVMRAASFDEAVNLALGTSYALTGGVYSRSPDNLERAREEFRVGNLYLNRKTTGAVVGRQPFGGFKLSGVGSKAGGPDYLLQFMEPRTVTENTLRRGFAPQEE
jgi:RHH-type proline utilization regulon transcriptional repressor/proline dehydrogenase/delta 1-pyrroline-5-carboxylate dehydrogenase